MDDFKKIIIDEKRSVRSILSTYKDSGSKLQFWQKNMKEKNTISGHIMSLDRSFVTIKIFNQHTFNSTQEIFCYSTDSKFALFKGPLIHTKENIITIELPRSIICKEERRAPRLKIDGNVEKYFSFYYFHPDDAKKILMRKRLIDVSETGLAFKNYKSDESNVVEGLKIFCEFKDKKNKLHNFVGEIVYKKIQSDEETEYAEFYRIGVKFNEPIKLKRFLSHLDLIL
ncbi:PilZ domain-containing protein [Bacteriovoracaceae bacterium]|nr:PilZ domain-containing protein [Bacteriovoracaceae bacterium]